MTFFRVVGSWVAKCGVDNYWKHLCSKPTPRWVLSYSNFSRASGSIAETTMGSLPLRGWSDRSFKNSREGHDETSRLSLRSVSVEVQWRMQLRHPNRSIDLNLVPTWPDQFDQALFIHFHCSLRKGRISTVIIWGSESHMGSRGCLNWGCLHF